METVHQNASGRLVAVFGAREPVGNIFNVGPSATEPTAAARPAATGQLVYWTPMDGRLYEPDLVKADDAMFPRSMFNM